MEGPAEPLLVDLRLRLDGDRDDGVGELHALEDDRLALVAERVARGGVAETDGRHDVARVDLLDLLALVGVHLEEAPDAFLLPLHRVVDVGARRHHARIHAEERERADVRVAHDLEGERREGLVVACEALLLVTRVRVDAADGRHVERRRQVRDHRVEQRLDALVLEGAAADHGDELHLQRAGADRRADVRLGDRLTVQITLHERLADVGNRLEKLLARRLGGATDVGGDLLLPVARTEALVLPHHRLHGDEIDDAAEIVLDAERQLDHDRVGPEALANLADDAVEVRADAVHLVDEGDTRNVVAVGLAPDGLGLRLDAADTAEHRDGAVEDAQAPLDLDREVDVAGRVDDVDAVVLPEAGGGGGRDGDAALLLLHHPVHDGGALMDLADLVADARVVEDALRRRGLAGINVGHDADVAGLLEGNGAGHGRRSDYQR